MSIICKTCGHVLQHRTPELEKQCFEARNPFDLAVEKEKDELIQVLKEECKMWKAQNQALTARLEEAKTIIDGIKNISCDCRYRTLSSSVKYEVGLDGLVHHENCKKDSLMKKVQAFLAQGEQGENS